MALTDAVLNVGVDAMTALLQRVSLHTADPGGTGAHEVTGGSPAYARKTPSWASGVAGVAGLTAALDFDVPACTVAYVGLWASDGTTWRGSVELPLPRTYTGQDVCTVDQLSVAP